MILKSAKERLQRYAALRLENENRLERLARLKADAELPAQREADGSAHTGSSGDRMARAVERYMEYEDEVRPIIEANKREMDAVRAAVEALEDPMEREVLRLRYLDGKNVQLLLWKEVAYKLLGKADEAAQKKARRIHTKAIKSLSALHG